MRMFLTSFQKSGTHQAMPMFMPACPSVEEKSYISHYGMDAWGFNSEIYPRPTWKETAEGLREFTTRAFGHIPYLPQFAEAVQAIPTKVVFNVRDPRDVVIAEVAYVKIKQRLGDLDHAWLNYRRVSDGKRIHELDDPILEMIKIDSVRWRNWLGWLDHPWTIRLQYEELRLRPLETAKWLTKELAGVPLPQSPEGMVLNTQIGRKPGSQTPSFRKGKVGEWKTYFRKRHRELAEELMGDIIERLGYEV